MPKKGEYVRFKNYERKIKPPIMIYADFENILVPEDNKKQYPGESYTNKYQKHVACSYIYKLICVDDNFIKLFKSYLVEDALREKCPNTDQKNSVSGLKRIMKILRTLLNVGFVMFMLMVMLK